MDLTKNRDKLLELYKPSSKQFSLVDVPELPFAVIEGEGSPDGDVGSTAVKDLYKAIYPIRLDARKKMGRKFVEPPVEMLYWADDMNDLASGKKGNWKWKAMITMPYNADDKLLADSVARTEEKTGPLSSSPRLERFQEGMCAQIMYVGDTEGVQSLLKQLYTEYLPQNGLAPAGAYHEIYLNDWNRVAPNKRKIILRQPVEKVS